MNQIRILINPSFWIRSLLVLGGWAWLVISAQLHANLVIDPSGAQPLFTTALAADGYVDDIAELRPLGLPNFRLFGQSFTELWVTDNGHFNSHGDPAFFPHQLAGLGKNMIAPLWDDGLLLDLPSNYQPNNAVLESSSSGIWYAITWQNVRLHLETVAGELLPNTLRNAQVVLFGANHTLRGFDFQTSDIAFSYRSHDGGSSGSFVDPVRESQLTMGSQLNAAIGLASQDGSSAVFPGGGANGRFEAAEAAAHLPWNDDKFILFREVLNQNQQFDHYRVTVERFQSIPEPGTLCLMAGASLISAFCRRR